MAPIVELLDSQTSELGFSISHQKVELDIDLPNRSLRGRTEITVNPHSRDLKVIRLNGRQCTIWRIVVNGKPPLGSTWLDPYKRATLPWKAGVHQYHMLQQKVEDQLKDPPEEELVITLAKNFRIDELDPFSEEAQNLLLSKTLGSSKRESLDGLSSAVDLAQSSRTAIEQTARFAPITVTVEYIIDHIRDGMQFVGWEEGDLRYPHAFSSNSLSPGTACCLFPCTDDLNARCTWDISIKCQKTIGDALRSSIVHPRTNAANVLSNGINGNHHVSDVDEKTKTFSDEDKALDLAVLCTGDTTDEIVDPRDPSRKTTSFICTTPISAQHVGFAIGPFEHVDLAEFRESDEDERLGQNAVPVHGYCLPGRVDEVKNTCLPIAKAVDYFTTTYGSYPFSDYKVCFVDDLHSDLLDTGSLSICSNRLLFPEDILEPLDRVTRQLVHALAVQWMGIHIVPREPSDLWVVIGMAYYMTDIFLRKLAGNNEYRYSQKKAADRVVELDVDRPSLLDTGVCINLDHSEREFMELKAPLVLFILDRRLTKAGGSAGLSRIIFKVCLQAKMGDLVNGAIDTQTFIRTCEKLGHIKLDSFYAQWIEGAGCPKFRVTQRFNKKKLIVEMMITQHQAENVKVRELESSTFMRDVKEEHNEVWAGNMQPTFTGPMTIRIHEADGTPYEHIIDIKDAKQTVDIPYNTKYKRLKRSRRQKERTAATNGTEFEGGGGDEPLINCLGDVLDTPEEEAAWRLATWSKDDEEKMNGESYEWIRMDADFEWICKMTVQMPAYMFVSQLRQDRDVVAQMESMQFMAAVQPHPLVSTELVKTLVDERYFHGVRTAAADILAKNAIYEYDWIGQFHLQKTFQTFFCYDDSPMTRSNDFTSRTSFNIQCAIIQGIAKIRDVSDKSPFSVRNFLFEKLKFNDNSNNEYSDCHYLATLMRALAEALAAKPPQKTNAFEDFDHDDGGDDDHFHNACLEEIDRYRRMDEWIPSYHNVLSTTALDCKRLLAKAGTIQYKPADFLQYTADGTSPFLRLNAFTNLMSMGSFQNDAILRWFLFVLSTDPSPYIRHHLLEITNHTLGAIAIGEHLELLLATQSEAAGGLTIEQESSTEARQLDLARKQTIHGALNALRDELASNETLKTELWTAITSPTLSLYQMGDLLEICDLLYTPETKLIIALRYPRYWTCTKVGKGKMLFKHSNRFRTKQMTKPQQRPLLTAPSQPSPSTAYPAIKRENSGGSPMPPPKAPKLIFKTKPAMSASPGPGTPNPRSREGSGDVTGTPVENKPKLRLSFGKLKGSGGQGSPTP